MLEEAGEDGFGEARVRVAEDDAVARLTAKRPAPSHGVVLARTTSPPANAVAVRFRVRNEVPEFGDRVAELGSGCEGEHSFGRWRLDAGISHCGASRSDGEVPYRWEGGDGAGGFRKGRSARKNELEDLGDGEALVCRWSERGVAGGVRGS